VDSRVVSDTVEFGMTYITGHDRSQLVLLPEAVDDYVGISGPFPCRPNQRGERY